jgi:hypothetical protein
MNARIFEWGPAMALKEKFIDQINRFAESARSLGCDDSEAHFNEVLGRIAKQKLAPKGHVDVEG